jgi:hypothetical protein
MTQELVNKTRRLIVLHTKSYLAPPSERQASFQTFRTAIKKLDYLQIVSENLTKPEIIVECPNNKLQDLYDELAKLEIVRTIDSYLPSAKSQPPVFSKPPTGKKILTLNDLLKLKK